MRIAFGKAFVSFAAAAMLCLTLAPRAPAQQATVPPGARFAIPSFASIVERILPSVVNIAVVRSEIDRHPVTSAQSAASLLRDAAANPDRTVLMLINRQGNARYLAFSPNASGARE